MAIKKRTKYTSHGERRPMNRELQKAVARDRKADVATRMLNQMAAHEKRKNTKLTDDDTRLMNRYSMKLS
jgi:hypothetical protein